MQEADTPLGVLTITKQQYPYFDAFMAKCIEGGMTPSDAAYLYAVQSCGQELTIAPLTASRLAACYMWDQVKRMYVFDESLAQMLIRQAADTLKDDVLSVDISTTLPVSAFYVKAPGQVDDDVDGFFVWIEENGSGSPVLQLAFLYDDMVSVTAAAFNLTPQGSVKESLPVPEHWLYPYIVGAARYDSRSLSIVMEHIDPSGPAKYRIHNLILRSLQLISYLCCDNADISKAPSSETDAPEGSAEEIQVGKTIGTMIRRSAGEQGSSLARKAHTRRGHWHSYWIGPKSGERRRITKWVAPVFVGSKVADVDVIAVAE